MIRNHLFSSKLRICAVALVASLCLYVALQSFDGKSDNNVKNTLEIEARDSVRTQAPIAPHKHHAIAKSEQAITSYVENPANLARSPDVTESPTPSPKTPAEMLRTLYSTLRHRGVSLVLTQTADLFDEQSFAQFSLLNPEVVLTRVGVFEEHLPVLESALNDFMNRQLPGVTRKDVKVADPRKKSADDKVTGHIFLILALEDSSSPLMKPKFAKPKQFFAWKRIHFQVVINRGVQTPDQPKGYYWIPAEPDDIGEPRLPAESYEFFDTRPLISDGNNNLLTVPTDKRAFVSEKPSAEFQECPSHSKSVRAKFESNWRGKVVTDAKAVRKYMTSIMAVKNLLRKYGILSWLNCGSLLGWYRQCSLIPKDPDIDLLHYSAPEFYPRIHAEILRRKDVFKIITLAVNEDSPGGYQRGFYWKLGVKGGINVDTYFYFGHKLYDMNHKKGDIKYFDFTDKLCSADLHGYRVYVLCSYEKNRDLSRVYYGPDIFSPK